MPREQAYHKLKSAEDFESIQKNGFEASAPAEVHWLGAGIYFFLDPNGYYWSRRWPCEVGNERTDSKSGIVATDIETSKALDLRSVEMMRSVRDIMVRIKMAIKFREKCHDVPDGRAFAYLVAEGGVFEKTYKFNPQVLIANFDVELRPYRITGSRALLTNDVDQEMLLGRKSQIQACVRDKATIGILKLHYP